MKLAAFLAFQGNSTESRNLIKEEKMSKPYQVTVGNGCRLHPDCFTCPYPDCIVKKNQATANFELQTKAEELYKSGHSIAQIATRLGKSWGTVQRWLYVQHAC